MLVKGTLIIFVRFILKHFCEENAHVLKPGFSISVSEELLQSRNL